MKLSRVGEMLQLTAQSPAVNAAAPGFEAVDEDIAGRPRTEPKDVGCQELSSDAPRRRPLTYKDVGPSWSPNLAVTNADPAAKRLRP
jgi:hypothetical protein